MKLLAERDIPKRKFYYFDIIYKLKFDWPHLQAYYGNHVVRGSCINYVRETFTALHVIRIRTWCMTPHPKKLKWRILNEIENEKLHQLNTQCLHTNSVEGEI